MNVDGFACKRLDSLANRVRALEQIVCDGLSCGNDVDGYEVVLIREPIPIALEHSAVLESRDEVCVDEFLIVAQEDIPEWRVVLRLTRQRVTVKIRDDLDGLANAAKAFIRLVR